MTPWMGAVVRCYSRVHKQRCDKCEHISLITLLFSGERPAPDDVDALCYDCRRAGSGPADTEPCRTK